MTLETQPIKTLEDLRTAREARLAYEKDHGPGSTLGLWRINPNSAEPSGEMKNLFRKTSAIAEQIIEAIERAASEEIMIRMETRLFETQNEAKKIIDLKILLREIFYQPVDSLENLLSLLREFCAECENEIAKKQLAQDHDTTEHDFPKP